MSERKVKGMYVYRNKRIGGKEPAEYEKVREGKKIVIYHRGLWIGTARGVTKTAAEEIANECIRDHKKEMREMGVKK